MTLPPVLTRASKIVSIGATSDTSPLRAALSSDNETPGWFGPEVLVHSADAIDLSHLDDAGLPLTRNHREMGERGLPLGRILGLSIDADGVTRGDMHFDMDDPEAVAVRGKVVRGVAPHVSITYQPLEHEERDGTTYITRWRPLAASIVTIPQDPSVGVGRSLPTQEPAAMAATPTAPTVAPGAVVQAGERQIANSIHTRARELAAVQPDFAAQVLDLAAVVANEPGSTLDTFGARALDIISAGAAPAAGEPAPAGQHLPLRPGERQPLMVPGTDHLEKQGRAMSLAMLRMARPQALTETDRAEVEAGNPFVGYRMIDLAEHSLRLAGVDPRGLRAEDIAKRAISMARPGGPRTRAISPGTAQYVTSDFPSMTENIGFKVMFDGFSMAPRTWDTWINTGGAPDFKQFAVPRLSAIELMPTVAENAPYTDLTRTDAGEHGTLVKRGGVISYSWESVVNNDLNGFADTMAAVGESAQATVDTYAYTLLLSNAGAGPVMGDTNNLFDSINHGNQGTDALDKPGIVATRTRMRRQTDDNARAIAPNLAFVLVPVELEDQANELAGAEWLVAASGTAQQVNTVRNTFVPISTHQLTDVNDWYGLDRRGRTARAFFLDGIQAPMLERESGWDTDALHFKGRIVFDIVFQDWRGTQRNVVA